MLTRFRNISLASTSVLACVAFSSPAFAQTAQPVDDTQPETVQEDNNAQATTGDPQDIVVTGSRIARPELETAAPLIASIGSEELETRAFTNVAAALDEVPGFGIPVAESGDQGTFSVGQNFVNLFGIGSNRTLTLVNGRRFVSSNTAAAVGINAAAGAGLQVDLNVIPVSLIERIDVLAVKGATTYGSDAIAGTVNLILKDDFEGMDVRGQLGITERGDRPTVYASATLGGNFGDGRGNVVFNAEFDKRDGILALPPRPSS
jgi:outer membrane receptor for ferrienterochelin and colicin